MGKKREGPEKRLDRRSDGMGAGARQTSLQEHRTGAKKLPFLRAERESPTGSAAHPLDAWRNRRTRKQPGLMDSLACDLPESVVSSLPFYSSIPRSPVGEEMLAWSAGPVDSCGSPGGVRDS